jgi:hypothetical protein
MDWVEVGNNGTKELQVSHGIDSETLKTIALPAVANPYELGAKFNNEIGEWVIDE